MLSYQILGSVRQYLAQFAASSGFLGSIANIYGVDVDNSELLRIRQQWLGGDFGLIPAIRVLTGGELGTANGAFAADLDEILVSADFLGRQENDAAVVGLLLEEIGHKVDRVLNGGVDTLGDEGAIFRLLVTGIDVSPEVLAGLRSADDKGIVILDGELVEVENQDFTGTDVGELINGTSGDDNISGLGGNDDLRGNGGNDSLNGGAGNDFLDGGVGDNTLNGGDGNDDIRSFSALDKIDGGAGDDRLISEYGSDTAGVNISFANNIGTISTNGTIQNIEKFDFGGGAGNDTVDASAVLLNNSVFGRSEFFGRGGNDVLIAGDGDQNLFGQEGNDSLNGGAGNDFLDGGVGDNTLNGGDGNDDIRSFSALDKIDGGAGDDRLISEYGSDTAGVNISFANNIGTISTNGTIQNIEKFDFGGGAGNDTVDASAVLLNNSVFGRSEFFGRGGNDVLIAGDGDQNLFGQEGNDSLNGGAGNDFLDGGVGDNTLNGGDGNDDIRSFSALDKIDGGAGDDRLISEYGSDTAGVNISFANNIGTISTNGTIQNIEKFDFGGGAGNDTVDASAVLLNNSVFGRSEFFGRGGNDVLIAGDGDQNLFGQEGNDSLNGGAGNDFLDGGVGDNTLNGGDGNDDIRSFSALDKIDGGAGDDRLISEYGSDTAGVNISFANNIGTISTNGTIQNIEKFDFGGGAGNDTVDASAVLLNNSVFGRSEFFGRGGNDVLIAGDGDQNLFGQEGNDSLNGGAGNDFLDGGVGDNTLNGGDGNDDIRSFSALDKIDGGAGDDRLISEYGSDTAGVNISFANNIGTISTNGTIQNIEKFDFGGGAGNDTVDASAVLLNNSVFGRSEFFGRGGNDVLIAGDGDQNLFGQEGNDSLNGGAGNDFLDGGVGDNTLNGGDGNDDIRSFSALDKIDGGAGDDRLISEYGSDTAGVNISFANNIGTISTNGTIQNIEKFDFGGGAGNDTVDASAVLLNNSVFGRSEFFGRGGNDVLIAGDGDQNLFGQEGNDSLNGGAGNDFLDGGVGDNTLNGGDGNDDIRSFSALDKIDGGAGDDRLISEYGSDTAGVNISFANNIGTISTNGTIQNIEKFDFGGGAGNDTVDASAVLLNNSVFGRSEFFGRGGNDVLIAGDGDQNLFGQEGNDSLNGGAGNDFLDGGEGNDLLIGGNFNNVVDERDNLTGGAGNDRFILGDSSNIYYDDRNISTSGNNDFATITDFNPNEDQIQLQGTASNYILQVSGTNTNILVDKAGSEPDELIAVLQNATGLDLASSAFQYVAPISQIAFSTNAYSTNENANGQVTLIRTGSTNGQISAILTLTNGTATDSTDYNNNPINVIFNDGESTMTIDIPIINDTTSEPDETINLALTNPSTGVTVGTQNSATLTILANDDNIAPTGSPTAILTGAVEDTSFSISEIDLLAGFSDANGDALSIEDLVATNGSIFVGNGYGNIGDVAAAQSFQAVSTSERIFTFVPNADFNGIVNLTYSVTDGISTLADQTLSFNVSPVNDAPTGTPTAVLANAALNSPYTINTSDLLAGFSDIEGDTLSIENLTANSGSLINNEDGTYTFTPNTDFNGLVNLNYSVTDGTTFLADQNININVGVGSVFSILPSISDEQIITSLLGNTTGLSNFQLTTSGSRQAVGLFQNDPFSFGQGIVLSTGLVSSLVGPRVGNVSTNLGNPGTVPGGRDAITLDITFDASTTSDQIFFQYIFGSEEFTEFSGSSFNDASTLTLNGVNLARLTNGNTVTVNNLTPSGNPTTFSPDYINNNGAGSPAFSQIALDGFTRPLGFAGALIPGASNRLVITVQDISDGILDSAIFLKANTLGIEQLPGVVQFLAPSYSVDENDTTLATITIIRTGGNNAAASVQLNLSDGTATAPNDYLNEPITINFALGENIKTITVPIVDDTIVELNETINLTLSNASTGLTIGTQSTALLTILANDNIAPTGSPTAVLTGATEDTAFLISAIDLLAGFSDVNGDNLFVTSLSSSSGSITNNEDGSYTFNPDADFNGDVTLSYGVTDGLATLANQTLNFNVAAVNDAPSGTPISVLNDAIAGNAYTINASDLLNGFSDVDGDTLSVVNLVATNGNLVDNGDGVYTFTPNADFIGVVNLTYDVTDGTDASIDQSLTFNVTPEDNENNIPDGSPTGTLPNTNEDTDIIINAIDLLAGFSDADGDTLSVVNLAATNGVLVNNNNGTFTFTPEANFNGEVTLVYDVTDGVAALTEQTLSFNVLAINDAPTGSPTTVLPDATEDEAFVINVSDLLTGFSDVDEDNLSVVNLVANNGTLENAGNDVFIFTPDANFNGIVTLTYDVSDGITSVINQTRSLNVVAVNDAPTGSPTAVLSTNEDTPFTINASELLAGFSDVDADTLSVVNLVASNGTLIENEDGSYGFTPDADFNGEVVLTYEVSDGTETLTEQTLSFNVTAVNDTPTGSPTGILADGTEDTTYTINASNLLTGFSDVDGDTLTVANLTANNGTLIDNSDGTYTFSPNANFNGLVNLTYDVSDGTGAITGQTLSFNLLAVNDVPTGSPTANLLGATEDNDFIISASDLLVGFNDVDGDILSVVNLVTSTGTLTENEDGNYTFTPNANFNGEVVLTYGVTDGIETLTGQSISFNVAAVNDAPTGSPTGVLTDGIEDTVVVINTSDLLAGFSDIDGDTLTVANLTTSNGTLINNNNGTYNLTPGLNFNGEVTLTYDVTDGTAAITAQTLIFNVTAVNDAPTGSPTATLPEATEDTAFTISTSDLLEGFSDVDEDILSIANLVASNGTLTDNGNETYTFSPNANFNGAVSLTYDVTDGLETLTSQTLNFSIAAVNDAPIGSPTATLPTVAEDTVVTINVADLLAGFSDIEGDTLSITNLVASNGTLTNNGGGIFSLNPEANFNGEVTVTYDVTDGLDSLTAQSLSFNITPVNDAPTGSPTATLSNTAEDSAIVINASDLLIGFSDVDGDTLSIINLVANNGVLVNNNNGTYNFTPTANFNGIIDLTYDVTDGAVTLTGQAQSFGVTPVNDAPTLQQLLEDQGAGQNQPFTFTIPSNTFADIDAGDTLTLSAALANGNPLPSWLSFNSATQTFSGTPPQVNIGSLNIRVTATDSAGASVSDVFALDIGLNIVGNLQANNLVGSNGFDTISGLNGNDTIDGGRGADRLDGGNGNDRLLGGTGRDTLIGGTGNDTLDGGADDDSYEASGTQAEFDTFSDTGVAGSDTLVNIGSTALTLNGFSLTNGIESINGNNQAILGNNNANVLNFSGVSLNNVLFIGGGTGNDSITGNSANNDLRGNNGNDTIDGGAGNDWLDGGSQNDSLLGAAGDDTIIGGSGDDTLDGGEGNDTYNVVGNQAEFDTFTDSGTSGTDTISNLAGTALTLNGFALNNGIDVINGNNQAIIGNNNGNAFDFSAVTFNNVSFVSGGNGNDSIIGTALSDNLQGGGGDDTISGGAGADRLDGGSQNDSLLGGIGDDTLVGGTGNDTLDGGDGSDTYEVAITQAEFDLFTDTGTSGNDTLRNTGNSSLTLNGFSITNGLEFVDGNNRAILGNNNNNSFNFSAVTLTNVLFVDGGSGNDFLVGSAASDNLRGGNGNDTIDGGNGADNLFGGAGNDSFIFNSSNTGIDTINDFTIGGDTLQISSAGFGGTGVVGAAGALAAARFTTGAAATTAAQRFVYDNASGSLFFDIDGNGSAAQVQIALLSSRPALNNNSFSIF